MAEVGDGVGLFRGGAFRRPQGCPALGSSAHKEFGLGYWNRKSPFGSLKSENCFLI
jgi:hypothetical protein